MSGKNSKTCVGCGNMPRVAVVHPYAYRSNMSLREKQTAARRQQILDAAEALIRQTGGTEFTMRILADVAQVSLATPYNFFGSKEGLLFALLERNLEKFMGNGLKFKSDDPFEQAIESAVNGVDLLVRDAVVLRPLYHVMFALSDPMHHPKYIATAFGFYQGGTRGLRKAGLLKSDLQQDTFCMSLMAHCVGALSLWVHEDIGDEYFRALVVFGFIQRMWMLCDVPPDQLKLRLNEVNVILEDSNVHPAFIRRN